MNRQDGYYWIRWGFCGGRWVIGQFHNGAWYSNLWIAPLNDSELNEIDENRIVRGVK